MLKKIKDKVKAFFKKIINDIKSIRKWKYEKLVMLFLIPIGILYTFLMLPSQVPDEQAHISRAYEISEGVLISRKDSKAVVPRDFITKLKPNIESYDQLFENMATKTDYNDRIEVVDSAASNPFILYPFSAIGFLIARVFGMNFVVGCILAKLMNFAVFCIVAYYSLKIIPFGKYVLTAIIFMPMVLHQATSISADSVINNLVILFVSFLLYLYFKESKIYNKDSALLILLSCAISISKYVYTPIIFIGAILIWSKKMQKKQKVITLTLMFVLPIILCISYYLINSSNESAFTEYLTENNVNSGEQISNIVSKPMNYVGTIINTLKANSTTYVNQMIGGVLGWLCIYVPKYVIGVYALLLLASCFVENNKYAFSTKQKIGVFAISGFIILLILTALYVTWTGVGNDLIEGVQGRYFIPIVLIALLALGKKNNYIKVKNVEYKLLTCLFLVNIPVLYTIFSFFNI